MYFESEKFEIDYWVNDGFDITLLKSPIIDGNKKQCLEFWYHMNGKYVGQLHVHFNVKTGDNTYEQTVYPYWMKKSE